MTARSVVCPECGTDVPYGRLSCSACGALVASVAGSARGPVEVAEQPAVEPPAQSVFSDGPEIDEPHEPYRVPSTPPAPRPDRWYSTSTLASQSTLLPSGQVAGAGLSGVGFFSDLPFRAPADVSGWIVAVGGAFSAIAFLLPWAAVGVAGTNLDPGYLGRWGLANPSYLLLAAGAVATFLLATIPSRIPLVASAIAVPILVGGVLLGVGWSYLTGPYGTGPGVDAMSLGALLMAVGGILELRPGRLARIAGGATPGRPEADPRSASADSTTS